MFSVVVTYAGEFFISLSEIFSSVISAINFLIYALISSHVLLAELSFFSKRLYICLIEIGFSGIPLLFTKHSRVLHCCVIGIYKICRYYLCFVVWIYDWSYNLSKIWRNEEKLWAKMGLSQASMHFSGSWPEG